MALLERAQAAFDEPVDRTTAGGPGRSAGANGSNGANGSSGSSGSMLPEALRLILDRERQSVAGPMRVAVVGRIKAGKSTLMNALLRGELVPTGPEELTFNVNWFVHAQEPGLMVHFRDGRAPEPRPVDWLGRLVDRTSPDHELLTSIRHVEVGLPQEILTRLQLIDTPGFGSFFEADSRNALEFLGLAGDELDRVTRAHTADADAVLYLFARGLADTDVDLVADFQGAGVGDITPVNAIAVLTKVDAYWSADDPDADPFRPAAGVCRRIAAAPGIDRLFFEVLPVCGLLAAGADGLTVAEIEVLTELAELPPEVLARRLRYAARFAAAEYDDLPVPPAGRAAVLERVGRYGIWLACRELRERRPDEAGLRNALREAAGVPRLEQLLLTHFGQRATLIKASGAVNRSRAACARAVLEAGPGAAAGSAAAAAAGRLEAFEVNEPGLAELALLRGLYRDESRLGLSGPEVGELLAVTGERGRSCAARLGADAEATPTEMTGLVAQRLGYWRRRADEFGLDTRTMHAARGIQRSYEVIDHHLRAAQAHLEAAHAHLEMDT